MVKVQENPTTGALLIQIPKAIAIAKCLKKGMDVDFLLNDAGEIIISIKK